MHHQTNRYLYQKPPIYEQLNYHDWESNGCFLDALDDPQDDETEDLNGCEQVNSPGGHVSKVHVIGLVLLGHEPDQDPVHDLHAL